MHFGILCVISGMPFLRVDDIVQDAECLYWDVVLLKHEFQTFLADCTPEFLKRFIVYTSHMLYLIDDVT